MGYNKSATLRYIILDKCFQDFSRKYSVENLIDKCSEGLDKKVSRSTIYEDIKAMKSENLYAAPIVSLSEEGKTYHRYKKSDFSIQKQSVTDREKEELVTFFEMISRFETFPGGEWITDIKFKASKFFQLENNSGFAVVLEDNKDNKGIEYITDIIQYIFKEQVLKVQYKSFESGETKIYIVSPQFLKIFNNRYFLFCYNDDTAKVIVLPLDRIENIDFYDAAYQDKREEILENLENIIGVSFSQYKLVQKVVIQLKSDRIAKYIETKPLHQTQKPIVNNLLRLEVQHNFELEQLILSYGDQMEVLQPEELKQSIKERVEKMYNFYNRD